MVGGGLLLLNAAVYGAYTLPRTLQQRSLASRVEVLRKEIDLERHRVEALRQRSEAMESNEKDTRAFYNATIGTRGTSLVPILRAIESLAAEQGVKIGGQSYKWEEVKGAKLERLVMTMPVSGNYGQLVGFVRALESSRHFLTIDQVSVRSGEGGQEAHLEMVVSSYFRPGSGQSS
jgi:Tfp pilus assembly protein PilO